MRLRSRIRGAWLVPPLALALALVEPPAAAQDNPDDDAKFNAKAALISARVIYLTSQSYAGVTPEVLKARNPELSFVADAPSSGPAVLSVKVPGPKEVRIAVYGRQTCWGIREEGRPTGVATLYAQRTGLAKDCTASSFKDSDFIEHERVWRN